MFTGQFQRHMDRAKSKGNESSKLLKGLATYGPEKMKNIDQDIKTLKNKNSDKAFGSEAKLQGQAIVQKLEELE